MNTYHQQVRNRIEELHRDGHELAKLAKPTQKNPSLFTIQDQEPLMAWLTSIENFIIGLFGKDSPQWMSFHDIKPKYYYPSTVKTICGMLQGFLTDFDNGMLYGVEFTIAGAFFENVLEEANYLCQQGHKDAAAVLARVAVENTLKKLVERHSIHVPANSRTASGLNELLKTRSVLNPAEHAHIQGWLRIGNAAAHGDFATYDADAILGAIQNIQSFVKNKFGR